MKIAYKLHCLLTIIYCVKVCNRLIRNFKVRQHIFGSFKPFSCFNFLFVYVGDGQIGIYCQLMAPFNHGKIYIDSKSDN